MKSVVYYAPNYIGYARVILSIFALYFIRRNPFLAFVCTILSGFVDHFDGDLAREHNETSNLGALMDFGCDKMSYLVLFFILGGIYPRMWLFFFLYSFLELLNPELGKMHENFNKFSQIFEYVKNDDTKHFVELKQLLYGELGLRHLIKQPILSNISEEHEASDNFNLIGFLFSTLYEWSWYASDFLYWIIYFGAYIQMKGLLEDNEISLKPSPLINSPLSSSRKAHTPLDTIREFFLHLVKIFDDVGTFFVLTLKTTPLWLLLDYLDSKLRMLKFYTFLKLVLNFNAIFRILGCICVFGGISKFYINFSWFLKLVDKMITIEDNFKAKYA